MSYKFQRASKDGNHKQIVDDLEKVGVTVLDLSGAGNGILDIITHYHKWTTLIEIKFGEKAEFKRKQLELMAKWTGFVGFASDFDQAHRLAKEPQIYAMTPAQKYRLSQFLVTWEETRLHFNTFLKVIQ